MKLINEKRKRRRRKVMIRRTLIVSSCVLLVAIVVVAVMAFVNNFFIKKPAADKNSQTANSSSVISTSETTAQAPSQNKTPANSDALTFEKPKIDMPSDTGHYSSNTMMYVMDNKILNLFFSSEAASKYYAKTISEFKQALGDDVKVYNMIAPTHPEFAIPQSLIDNGTVSTTSQAENIKLIYQSYTADVIPINCYNELSRHNDEYIFFNTDHHWTGLGGYYAYKAFAEQTEQTPLELSDCTENKIENFEGTLLEYAPETPLDTVYYYTFPYDTYAQVKRQSASDELSDTSVYFEGETSGVNSYGVFIWGDNALFVEHNDNLNSGKKIAVVKDSYGNAVAPYLTANYDEVHVIDYRYFDTKLSDYCKENGINEVLFINNEMSCNTASSIDQMKTIL